MADVPTRAGTINSSNPMDKSGLQFPGRDDTLFTVHAGSSKVSVTGTEGDDIVRVMPGSGDIRLGLGAGRNQVILPGNAADYKAEQPKATDYPPQTNKTYWKDGESSIYGKVSVLENVTTGERYTITSDGPTRVIFDGESTDASRPNLTPGEADRITKDADSEKCEFASSRALLYAAESGETPEEKGRGRFAGTREASDSLTRLKKEGVPFAEMEGKLNQSPPPSEDILKDPIKGEDWTPKPPSSAGPSAPAPSPAPAPGMAPS